MSKTNDWQETLRLANEDLSPRGITITVENNEGFFSVNIGEIPFAENFYEDELVECISDAWAHARIIVCERETKRIEKELEKSENIRYRKIHGWTHTDPALIYTCTEVAVYFHDNDRDEMLNVSNFPDGIDHFENMNGEFYVRDEDYDEAYRQLEEHDRENNN